VQSTDLEEIKVAIFEQAFLGCSKVSWGEAQVIGVRCRKGHLQACLRGTGRWYNVEGVTISRPRQCPTGACDLCEEL
jgi:hypothetical protein